MTLTLAALALLGAFNPGRLLHVRPERVARDATVVAGLAVVALGAVTISVGPPVLDAARISPATTRMATGFVVAVIGAAEAAGSMPGPAPVLAGWRAGLVPLALPGAFSPALALVLISLTVDRGVVVGVDAAVAIGIATALVIAWIPTPGRPRAVTAAFGALAVVAGLGLTMDGLFDI